MKRLVFFNSAALVLLAFWSGCSFSSGSGSGTTSTATRVTNGIGNSIATFQSMGGALGAGSVRLQSVGTLAANTKCTVHAEPGEDGNADGVVDQTETISQGSNDFALQKFYCTLASNSDGPESISGAVGTLKTVMCALERQLGSLTYATTATVVPITSLTFTTACASQHFLDQMGAAGAASVTTPVTSGTVTTQLNPNFADVAGNTYYTHGFELAASFGGQPVKFLALAKFDPSFTGNPLESGDFEFLTYGTGMQGTAVEMTAGKIQRTTATTGKIWYEMRINRQKTTPTDPICPDPSSSSCGFARHIRLSTNITFAAGDISDVSGFSGFISDSNDDTGSGGSGKQSHMVSAQGSLATGLTGKIWTAAGQSAIDDMNGATVIGGLSAGTTSCIIGNGTPVSTTCGASAAVLTPASPIQVYFLPANDSTWLSHIINHGGVGYPGTSTITDEQFAL